MPNERRVNAHPRSDITSPRVIRPMRQLFRQGLIAVLALTTPVFAVLYWMTVRLDSWPIVLAVHLAVLALTAVVIVGYLGACISVSPDGIDERGFFGHTRSARIEQIGSILVLEIYRDSALDTQPQLFVCDHDGQLLIRMRGMFWSRADMDVVIDQLDVPVNVSDSTFTMADLRRTRPELLYWFEHLPRLSALSVRARA